MNWLNIELTTLRSEAFVGCEPTDRATWLCLMAYCADQENGGTIQNAETWGDRKWMQLVGITKEASRRDCDLWRWNGGSLFVAFYPTDKEVGEFLESATFANGTIKALFAEWMDERRKMRKYGTLKACIHAAAKLSTYPEPVQEQALRNSIGNGWQGVFPENCRMNNAKKPPSGEILL